MPSAGPGQDTTTTTGPGGVLNIAPRNPALPKPPPPDNYTDRLKGLSATHQWMPPQTAATLAALPAPDKVVADMANALKRAYGSSSKAVKYVTEDPLLQKTPSLGLYIRSYLTNTIGPWPLTDSDLVHVQKGLMRMGFNDAGAANGVWSPDWNTAFSLYAQQLRQQALGGNQPGSTPFGSVLHALNDLLPREAATAVGGFITHIPDGVRNDLRTLAGGLGSGLLSGVLTPSQSASLENIIPGPHVTPQQSYAAEGIRGKLVDDIQVAGDLLATHGLLRAGGAIADAARATSWTSLSREAAQRGPGTIASKFLTAGTDTSAPTGLLSKAATTNVPILRLTGPVADQLFTKDGFYYRARSLLAAPYAVPGVQAAGTAVGQLGIAGAKIRAIGTAESLAGGQPSPLSQSIDHFQAVNQFDDAIQTRFGMTILGHHFSPSLNTLAWVLHPPMSGPGLVSASIGKDITQANTAVQDALGPTTGFGLSIERGVNWTRHGNQHLTLPDLIEQAGGEAYFTQFWLDKIYQHAAAHYAEVEWNKLSPQDQMQMAGIGGTFQDKAAALDAIAQGALTRMVQGHPEDLQRALHEMTTDDNPLHNQWGGHNGLAKRIAGEIERSSLSPRDWLKSNMSNYGEASRIMRDIVVPRRNELVTEDVPHGSIGMARLDYLTSEDALAKATDLEQQYQDAMTAVRAGEKGSFERLEAMASAIRAELVNQYGIDGPHMPHQDDEMVALLKQKADNQATRMFLRERPLRLLNPDPHPTLMPGAATASGRMDNLVHGPLFTNLSPRDALNLIYEDRNHQSNMWFNDRNQVQGNRGVTIEHESENLRGSMDGSNAGRTFQQLRNRARFNATRTDTTDLTGVRSVEIRPTRGESDTERSARTLLTDKLRQAGFIPFDQGTGIVRWVREDMTGGTVPASPQLRDAFARLEELGYMPVLGHGIGFSFFQHPTMDLFDSHLTRAKNFVERLGLSPENIPSQDIGVTWNMEFTRRLLDKVEQGKIRLAPTHTVQTVLAELRNKDALPTSPGLATLIQKSVGRYSYAVNRDRLTDALMAQGKGEIEARQQAARQLSQSLENPLGLVRITERNVKDLLQRRMSENVPNESQTAREMEFQGIKTGAGGVPMYSDQDAHEVYRTIQETNAAMPARLIGWQHVENLMALGLSYMGRPIPGAAGRVIENLPTRLITLRNKARFTLSPEFAARRVVKVNVKLALDGVAPTFFPMHELNKMGVYKAAMKYLDKVMPELKNPSYDEGTQALYADDPWGIYNHRNYEAYAAWRWKEMGKTDTEIRQLIVKDFGYGSKTFGEGRSALERSVNFVFFPFSFDKTLYRNVGGYLLDHTAQRLVLQAGLEAYQRYNQSDPNGAKLMSSSWWLRHAPVINEALRLNAFAHGVGLGQFGGLNAPLLNLFIPQSYPTTSQGVQTLRGILPIMRQFQDLYSEVTQTFKVSKQVVEDQFINNPTIQGFGGAKLSAAEKVQGIFFAKPVAEVSTAQLTDAYVYRRQLTAMFKTYIDYDAHHSQKMKLGDNYSVFGQWAGHTIDATLVNQLVNQKYPAFPIDNPAIYYAKAAAAITNYTQQMHNANHPQVVEWITVAQKVGTEIYRSKMDTTRSAWATKVLRQYAVLFAETIPGFLTFYNNNFRWEYGPLEKVR